MDRTERILEQGKALVRAIEALETIEPTGPFERAITWLQLQGHRRRLRRLIGLAGQCLGAGILSGRERR